MTLALDGAAASTIASSGNPVTVGPISTTFGYGKVYILIVANSASPTSITGGGLTFSQRASISNCFLWAADVGSSPLSGVTFTVNFGGSTTFCTMVAQAISNGGNSNGLAFDSGGPQTATSSGSGPQASMTTANAVALLVAGGAYGADNPTSGVGWTDIFGAQMGSFAIFQYQGPTSGIGTFTEASNKDLLASGNTLIDAVIAGGAGSPSPPVNKVQRNWLRRYRGIPKFPSGLIKERGVPILERRVPVIAQRVPLLKAA